MPHNLRHDMYRVITGTGLATAQGADVETNWQRLFDGAVLHDIAGRVPIKSDGSSRVSQLAIHVAKQAIQAGGWRPEMLSDARTGLVVGTSKGPIEEWIIAANSAPRRAIFGLSELTADLAFALKLGFGPRLTLASACASGLHALIGADNLLKSGQCDRVLVVAAESSISDLFQANFKRLGVLADPAVGCQPFDKNRRGFLLAAAAAAVCLELSDAPKGVWLGSNAMLADATHLTGLAPDGDAIRHALLAADISNADLIHAHGTGTDQNDAVEAAAIRTTAGNRQPLIYSHKHAVGHTQGASGLISVVLNVEMHRRQTVLPNANTPQPIEMIATNYPRQPTARSIQHSVIHAAGFGGAIGSIGLHSA